MTPYHESDGVVLYHGDCLQVLRTLSDESVDAVVSDPPYGLSFMGKRWDYDVPSVEIWQQVLRVLKPGGHLLAFAGTRTQHRMAVRIEDAGFEIRDMIAWVYGSGFPKSLDVSKAIDKRGGAAADFSEFRDAVKDCMKRNKVSRARLQESLGNFMLSHYLTAGSQPAIPCLRDYQIIRDTVGLGHEFDRMFSAEAEREVVGKSDNGQGRGWAEAGLAGYKAEFDITAPATEAAKQWAGWGTSLKPSFEPVTVARKPLCGTVAENVLQHGTGGLNVDGCRIPMSYEDKKGEGGRMKPEHCNEDSSKHVYSDGWKRQGQNDTTGRWPANLIHDGSDEVAGLFPQGSFNKPAMWQSDGDGADGTRALGKGVGRRTAGTVRDAYGDTGSAARFFYCAKASKRDRGESNRHPTVKPTALMRYLCRLLTPPGGLVLDPFTGSGSTGRGAVLEGFRFVGMELDAEHIGEAKRRILEVQNGWTDEPEDEPAEDLPGQRLLF